MAARCCMCLLKTFTNNNKNLASQASRYYFTSHLHLAKPIHNLTYVFCAKFSRSYAFKSSQTNDSPSILSQLQKSSGSIKETPSPPDADEAERKKRDLHRMRTMKYTFIAFGIIFSGAVGWMVYEFGSPNIDSEGNVLKDEFSDMPTAKAYIFRTYREVMYYNKLIREPSRDKLLPDPLTDPYFQPPYTLVLEMTGILVHPEWSYQTGWRFKKRPGVDYFLQQIGPPMFEVVIYTAEQGFTAYPLLDSLDPNGYIMYRLFRDSTRYLDGHHIKDLSCLNRDLSKVIFVDWNQESFALQPQNALMMKKWSGNDDDKMLFDLASLLRTIAISDVDDVRTVLEYYSQFDDPVAVYKENQKKLQEEKTRLQNMAKTNTLAGSVTSHLRGRR